MTPTLIVVGALLAVFIILNVVMSVIVRSYYIVPEVHEALLVVSSKVRTYRGKGVLALPILTQVTRVPLSPVELSLSIVDERLGEVAGSIFVVVEGKDSDAILLAGTRLCGTQRAFEVEVSDKLHSCVQSAARTALFRMGQEHLSPYEIEEFIGNELDYDARKLGLTVLSVSILAAPITHPNDVKP
jgi:hypothetical protein